MVLEALNLLLQVGEGDLLILDDKVDLELLDTEANGDKFGARPYETILLNGSYVSLKLGQVGLII